MDARGARRAPAAARGRRRARRTTRAGRRCMTSRGCVRTRSRSSARVYWDDEYVERTMALETVSLLGNCRPWITNEYEHGGYRVDPARRRSIDCSRCWTIWDARAARSEPRLCSAAQSASWPGSLRIANICLLYYANAKRRRCRTSGADRRTCGAHQRCDCGTRTAQRRARHRRLMGRDRHAVLRSLAVDQHRVRRLEWRRHGARRPRTQGAPGAPGRIREGRLSFDKIRAVTKVATRDDDEMWCLGGAARVRRSARAHLSKCQAGARYR